MDAVVIVLRVVVEWSPQVGRSLGGLDFAWACRALACVMAVSAVESGDGVLLQTRGVAVETQTLPLDMTEAESLRAKCNFLYTLVDELHLEYCVE